MLFVNRLDKFSSNNCFTINSLPFILPIAIRFFDDVVQEYQASLVTVNQHPFAHFSSCFTYLHGQHLGQKPITIDFWINLIAKVKASAFLSGFGDTTVGEITTLHHLFRVRNVHFQIPKVSMIAESASFQFRESEYKQSSNLSDAW